jgi:hypothetical protein
VSPGEAKVRALDSARRAGGPAIYLPNWKLRLRRVLEMARLPAGERTRRLELLEEAEKPPEHIAFPRDRATVGGRRLFHD